MKTKHPYGHLFDDVKKPLRYLGGEPGCATKEWSSTPARICIAFPDAYEIGMSHLGLRILYDDLNSHELIGAERVFAPWPDMEQLLKRDNLPLISLESQTALSEFHVLGFSLQFELNYTNILTILHLGGIPVWSAERDDHAPLVIAGGPVATHAEPIAPFIDAFLIGDGEELLPWFMHEDLKMRQQGLSRSERLARFNTHPSIYVPALYETEYDAESGMRVVTKQALDTYGKVTLSKVSAMSQVPSAARGPAPHIAVFNRAAVEISRGCNQGCRFCQAGYLYRPFRTKSPDTVMEEIKEAVGGFGYQEVSLTALSTLDYPGFEYLLKHVSSYLSAQDGSIAISSLRAYDLPQSLLESIRTGRGGGLTFAPEAGTQRLRDVINKNISEEDLVSTCQKVAALGWSRIKLYFMLGLPTETDDDLRAISDLAHRVALAAKEEAAGKPPKVTVSVSNFVPKPHTPFQWLAFTPREEILRKQDLVYSSAEGKRCTVKVHTPKESWLEAVLSRSDRDVSNVIYEAWSEGARFDGWRDFFDLKRWFSTFERCGIDPEKYLKAHDEEGRLPWDHVETGVTGSYLRKEYDRALKGQPTLPCLESSGEHLTCYSCGAACNLPDEKLLRSEYMNWFDTNRVEASPIAGERQSAPCRLLIRYSKSGNGVYMTHLDLLDHFPRIFRAAGIAALYTQGFSPRPKLSYSPPPGRHMVSSGELIELHCERAPDNFDEALRQMNEASPHFMNFYGMEVVPDHLPPLSKRLRAVTYQLTPPASAMPKGLEERCEALMNEQELPVERRNKRGKVKLFNARPSLLKLDWDGTNIFCTIAITDTAAIKPSDVATLLIPEQSFDEWVVERTAFTL